MARTIDRLTWLGVKAKKTPGLYSDGNGLYLQITKEGVKSWLFRYMLDGKARGMGLGPTNMVDLKEAREAAVLYRKQLKEGVDPLDQKHSAARAKKAETAKDLTFASCAALYIDAHSSGWNNAKHVDQWKNTLATYADPVIGHLSVAKIDTDLVKQVLLPIWTTKNETATRLRGRIEKILGWAKVRGLRSGENPARWRDNLDNLLAKPSKIQKIKHHAALPFVEISDFIRTVRSVDDISAQALEFLILTAARTGEVIGATWKEFDLDAKAWTIPAARMKMGKEHRVALSDRALEIVKKRMAVSQSDIVFPGRSKDKPMSNMAMLQLLKRLNRKDLTAHGFRSTFRDWAGETTAHPREVIEHALAHGLPDATEAAYARGTLFDKRRQLMADWATYCSTPSKEGKDQ